MRIFVLLAALALAGCATHRTPASLAAATDYLKATNAK